MVSEENKRSYPPNSGDITNVLTQRQMWKTAEQQTNLHVGKTLQKHKDQQTYPGKGWAVQNMFFGIQDGNSG